MKYIGRILTIIVAILWLAISAVIFIIAIPIFLIMTIINFIRKGDLIDWALPTILGRIILNPVFWYFDFMEEREWL